MDTETVVIFLILLGSIYYFIQLNRQHVTPPVRDESGHVKPEHLLYDVMKQFSSGDKV